MTLVVLDTNILISSLWSKNGAPAKVVQKVLENQLVICHDYRIMNEYKQVLHRPKFSFDPSDIRDLLEFIQRSGLSVTAEPDDAFFADESDRKFYDIAKSLGAYLITRNTKHYPAEPFVMSPADFLNIITTEDLIAQWRAEESHAFQGWDFSHLNGRWIEPDLPWDYVSVVKSYLMDEHILLDMGTGGGEVLLSIGHPYKNTFATEAYEPNFELCKETLSPLGITVVKTYTDENFNADDKLPFDDGFFNFIINRHESFDLAEVNRTLKHGGIFITQQVGNKNTREYLRRLNDDFTFDLPLHTVKKYVEDLSGLGFQVLVKEEVEYPVKVYDVGALVYMAKIIVWEYPGFSVSTHLEKLLDCQREIEEKGFLAATGHRFLIVAQKHWSKEDIFEE